MALLKHNFSAAKAWIKWKGKWILLLRIKTFIFKKRGSLNQWQYDFLMISSIQDVFQQCILWVTIFWCTINYESQFIWHFHYKLNCTIQKNAQNWTVGNIFIINSFWYSSHFLMNTWSDTQFSSETVFFR